MIYIGNNNVNCDDISYHNIVKFLNRDWSLMFKGCALFFHIGTPLPFNSSQPLWYKSKVNNNGQIQLSTRCFVDNAKTKHSMSHGRILKIQLNEPKIKQNY